MEVCKSVKLAQQASVKSCLQLRRYVGTLISCALKCSKSAGSQSHKLADAKKLFTQQYNCIKLQYMAMSMQSVTHMALRNSSVTTLKASFQHMLTLP